MTAAEPEISIGPIAPGGWANVEWGSGSTVLVRFSMRDNLKSLRIAEVRIPDPTSELLSSLPLSRIEAAASESWTVMLAFAGMRAQRTPDDLLGWFEKEKADLEIVDQNRRCALGDRWRAQ